MGHLSLSLLAIYTLMYPGIGKLPLSPVPYELPNPQYPHGLEITPTRPSNPVIPGVIFRPPSEILRNFGELQGDQPAPIKPGMETGAPVSDSGNPVGPQRSRPVRESQESADPQLRPTRRQPLGW